MGADNCPAAKEAAQLASKLALPLIVLSTANALVIIEKLLERLSPLNATCLSPPGSRTS